MTSTRNKNTSQDYNLEQKLNKKVINERLYLHSASARPVNESIPTVGYIPSHMSNYALSNNPIDIESTLFGIGSTNLETSCEATIPSLKNLEYKDFFSRQTTVIMPYPLVIDNNQRPFPI